MDYEKLFRRARPLLRLGGGIAVIANGTPLWQQASEWSRALRRALEEWFDTTMTALSGTDRDTQLRYVEALVAAGYEVREVTHGYQDELSLEQLLGGVYSALSPNDLRAHRRAFAEHITRSLPNAASFTEVVPVTALIGIAALISLVTAQIVWRQLPIGRPVPSTELTIGSGAARALMLSRLIWRGSHGNEG